MSIEGVILRNAKRYTVTRTPEAVNVDGVFTPPASTTSIARMAVQPSSGRDLQIFAEAGITGDKVVMFSLDEIHTRVPGQFDPDRFEYKGFTYTVILVDEWDQNRAHFWKVYAARGQR